MIKRENHLLILITKHLSSINTVLLILALIISVFPFGWVKVQADDTKIKTVALLLIIATEFFVMTVGYLEKITKSTKKLDCYADQLSKVSYSTTPVGFDGILQAQNCIFISGAGMQSIHSIRDILASIDNKVTIALAVEDYKNPDVMCSLEHFFGLKQDQWKSRRTLFNEGIKRIRQNRDINIIEMDIFSPIAFVAVDYKNNTSNSFIQAKHYLFSENEPQIKSFYCIVHPGTDLYEYYRNQILIIENRNGKLAKKRERSSI